MADRAPAARALLQLDYNLTTPVVEFLVIIGSVTMGLPMVVYIGAPPALPSTRLASTRPHIQRAVWKSRQTWRRLLRCLRTSAHKRELHHRHASAAPGEEGEEAQDAPGSPVGSSLSGSESGSGSDWDVEEAIGLPIPKAPWHHQEASETAGVSRKWKILCCCRRSARAARRMYCLRSMPPAALPDGEAPPPGAFPVSKEEDEESEDGIGASHPGLRKKSLRLVESLVASAHAQVSDAIQKRLSIHRSSTGRSSSGSEELSKPGSMQRMDTPM